MKMPNLQSGERQFGIFVGHQRISVGFAYSVEESTIYCVNLRVFSVANEKVPLGAIPSIPVPHVPPFLKTEAEKEDMQPNPK